MSKAPGFRNFIVGVAFLGGLLIFGVATLKVGELSWLSAAPKTISVRFANVDGLSPGDRVFYQGFRVGMVDDIELNRKVNADPILVKCRIFDDKFELGKNPSFEIRSSGALGGRHVEITSRSEDEIVTPVLRDGEYRGEAAGDLFKQLENLVQENSGRITEILEGIHNVVEELRTGRGILGRVIHDVELGDDFSQTIRSFREMSDTFSSVAKSIEEAEGLLGSLIKDPKARDEALKLITNLSEVSEELRAGEGILAFLLRDEAAKEELRVAISNLREVTDSLRQGDGVVAKLLTDGELAKSFEEILESARDIVNKVNSGHGTLGQIVNNDQAWRELVSILVQAREALEDLREQAPISTFVNALFSAF